MGSGASGASVASPAITEKPASGHPPVSSSNGSSGNAMPEVRARQKPKRSLASDCDVPGSRQITACLTKRGKYGLRLAKRGDNLWRIIEIQDDGSIAQHNLEHPDVSLRVNDLLLKINGEDPDISILEKAEEGIQVEVTLLRVPQSIAPPPFSTQAIKPTNL
mmetsp:Transcript_49799/g.101322  ORF Transcript_49799/g.101322 Transcript_49799/m.101322 type:complete len:162 (+) Transcript_49799:36-521(+)